MSAGSSTGIDQVPSTPQYSETCPNLSPEVVAALQAAVSALNARICEGDQGQAQFTNSQVQALQDQMDLLSGATDLSSLTATVNAIRSLIDPDGDGTLDQLFAPLQTAIDSANAAATAAQNAAANAQSAATAAQQTATSAQTAATNAQSAAATAQNKADETALDVRALTDLVEETSIEINDAIANVQAAHCAEKLAMQTALQQFVNVTLPQLLNTPCELPAPVVGPGSTAGGEDDNVTDPSQMT